MTQAEQIMFEIEEKLPLVKNYELRHWLRGMIRKIEALDMTIIDLSDSYEELRQKYSHFDEFLHLIPGMSDDDDYGYDAEDDED